MKKGIIVEGVDCSGKSTLIRHLKSELSRHGWDSYDMCHRKESQFERYMMCYVNADRVLFDRAHFSEVVYGDEWRNGVHFSEAERKLLDNYAFNNFLVVFVYSPESELRTRYEGRDIGQIIKPSELGRVQDRFLRLFDQYGDQVIRYEATSMNNLRRTVDYVFKELKSNGLMRSDINKYEAPHSGISRILLEGVNGSGKSTLAKLLKINLVGWSIKTLDYRKEPPFERFLREYANNQEIIFDRGHFSEIVYGNIFRAGKHFSKNELDILNNFAKEKIKVIFCDPPIKVLEERIKNIRYPKHIHESRFTQVRREFIGALDRSGIEYATVDTSDEKEIKKIVSEVRRSLKGTTYASMGWDKPK